MNKDERGALEKVRVGMGAVQSGARLGSGLEFRMEMDAGKDKMGPGQERGKWVGMMR